MRLPREASSLPRERASERVSAFLPAIELPWRACPCVTLETVSRSEQAVIREEDRRDGRQAGTTFLQLRQSPSSATYTRRS